MLLGKAVSCMQSLTPTWPHKNGPWVWDISLPREKEPTQTVGFIALGGTVFPCFKFNAYSFLFAHSGLIVSQRRSGNFSQLFVFLIPWGMVESFHYRGSGVHAGESPRSRCWGRPVWELWLLCPSMRVKCSSQRLAAWRFPWQLGSDAGAQCLESSPGFGDQHMVFYWTLGNNGILTYRIFSWVTVMLQFTTARSPFLF